MRIIAAASPSIDATASSVGVNHLPALYGLFLQPSVGFQIQRLVASLPLAVRNTVNPPAGSSAFTINRFARWHARAIPAPSGSTARQQQFFPPPTTGRRSDRPVRLLSVLREDHSGQRVAAVRPGASIVGSRGWGIGFPEELGAFRSESIDRREPGRDSPKSKGAIMFYQ